MGTRTRIIIIGYGNVGRGVKAAIESNADLELAAVFSRGPDRVRAELPGVPVFGFDRLEELSRGDVAVLCGGSKDDLPEQGPLFARRIHTVDSFDNHSRIPEYFAAVDEAAREGGKVALVSAGWDPGTFSLQRVLGAAFVPGMRTYAFYGVGPAGGLSMGHSDALRTLRGVADARQFTHAVPEAIERARSGENPDLKPGDMHWRECFVVLEQGADAARVEKEIKEMPGYFAPYRTVVHFVDADELARRCAGFPHDGLVVGAGQTGPAGAANAALVEYRNAWGSNPEATACILAAHARAVARLAAEGKSGACTILDVPPAYFSPLDRAALLRDFM